MGTPFSLALHDVTRAVDARAAITLSLPLYYDDDASCRLERAHALTSAIADIRCAPRSISPALFDTPPRRVRHFSHGWYGLQLHTREMARMGVSSARRATRTISDSILLCRIQATLSSSLIGVDFIAPSPRRFRHFSTQRPFSMIG